MTWHGSKLWRDGNKVQRKGDYLCISPRIALTSSNRKRGCMAHHAYETWSYMFTTSDGTVL